MSAKCVCATPCGQEVPVTVLWTTAPVWPVTSRSVMAEEYVNVAPVSAMMPNFRGPPVKLALPVQESALRTSKFKIKTCHCAKKMLIWNIWYIPLVYCHMQSFY